MRQLREHLAGSVRRHVTDEDYFSPRQLVLRARGDPAGGREWFPTKSLYHQYDVCDSTSTGVGAEDTNSVVCMFYRLYQTCDSVDRTLLLTVLARFGVPQKMISNIRQLYDGMRACVRLDDRVCSGWFAWNRTFTKGVCLHPSF